MHIDPLAINESRLPSAAPMRSLWPIGTIIEAVAVRDATSGQLWLQLQSQPNKLLLARLASGHSTGPLDGEQLKLRVLRESPVLALESLEEENESSTQDALRRSLPLQSSPSPLLANLAWLMRNPDVFTQLPRHIQQALQRLWQSFASAEQLVDADQLQRALRQSGTFLEANLTKSTLTPEQLQADYKAALLVLRQQLQQAPTQMPTHTQPPGPMPSLNGHLSAMPTGPASLALLDDVPGQLGELKQQIDGSLARVQTNQLLNDQVAQQGQMSWLVEVPVNQDGQAELLRFKFERDARRAGEEQETWSVEVALDLGRLGALVAQISLSPSGLNVRLRSESAQLVSALNDQLDILAAALRDQGLPLTRLLCLHGQPVDATQQRMARLLDLHA